MLSKLPLEEPFPEHLEAEPRAARYKWEISLTFQCLTLKIHTNVGFYTISYLHLFYFKVVVYITLYIYTHTHSQIQML